MKRKRLNYETWTCILSKETTVKREKLSVGDSWVVLNDIKKVSEPQTWAYPDKTVTICDNGMQWLCIMPVAEHYCITAILNADLSPVLWYIDMIDTNGVDNDGIPFFHDLYLDLVVRPEVGIRVDDMDELVEAYRGGDIAKAQYELALATADKLQDGLLASVENIKKLTDDCCRLFGKI